MNERHYGDWEIISNIETRKNKEVYCFCRCKCGVSKYVNKRNIISGRSKKCLNCSTRERSLIDTMISQKFGSYLVLEKAITKNKDTHYRCICDCGAEKIVRGTSLRQRNSLRCFQCALKKRTQHGISGSSTHLIWKQMKQRCMNPNSHNYKYYGGRGIKVCDRWLEFNNFLEDMGERPMNLQIDRINNDGDYEPGNCRWVDALTNNKNKNRK